MSDLLCSQHEGEHSILSSSSLLTSVSLNWPIFIVGEIEYREPKLEWCARKRVEEAVQAALTMS